jgi:hypothetical protein
MQHIKCIRQCIEGDTVNLFSLCAYLPLAQQACLSYAGPSYQRVLSPSRPFVRFDWATLPILIHLYLESK